MHANKASLLKQQLQQQQLEHQQQQHRSHHLHHQQEQQQQQPSKPEITVKSQLTDSLHNAEQTDLAISSILNGSSSLSTSALSPPHTHHSRPHHHHHHRGHKRYRSASSCTDDADETSWNLQQLNSLATNNEPDAEVIIADEDMNVVYEEDIAGTVDISSSSYEQPKKQSTVRRGPKKKKPGEARPNLSNYSRKYRQTTIIDQGNTIINLRCDQLDAAGGVDPNIISYQEPVDEQIIIESSDIIYDPSSDYVMDPSNVIIDQSDEIIIDQTDNIIIDDTDNIIIDQSDNIIIDQSDNVIIDESQVIMDSQYIQYVNDVSIIN